MGWPLLPRDIGAQIDLSEARKRRNMWFIVFASTIGISPSRTIIEGNWFYTARNPIWSDVDIPSRKRLLITSRNLICSSFCSNALTIIPALYPSTSTIRSRSDTSAVRVTRHSRNSPPVWTSCFGLPSRVDIPAARIIPAVGCLVTCHSSWSKFFNKDGFVFTGNVSIIIILGEKPTAGGNHSVVGLCLKITY